MNMLCKTLSILTILGTSAGTCAASVIYDFTFFDSNDNKVGSGFLSVDQSVLDDAPDLSAINPGIPENSRFVPIGDLSGLVFTVFGTGYTQSDHNPVAVFTVEGVLFNDDQSFNRFIDANVPGNIAEPGATGVDFGSEIGSRLLFDERFPNGYVFEDASTSDGACLEFKAGCTFSVVRAVPLPPALPLFLTGVSGMMLLGRRRPGRHTR